MASRPSSERLHRHRIDDDRKPAAGVIRLGGEVLSVQIERLSVVLQAVARCSWFTSCLGLSDMPLSTPTAYLPPQGTRFSHAPRGT